ncbi:hypothetical protein [Brevibacillus nitrificans]|uniref:hypothetical protein n=1 Tax=Brevibacillus nitrificans TaxID=651560 RepID=UPI0028603C1A|nr:hypothetical protein [Brevibacillus nitrificans]MDR7317343.1 hypothetical protein [Brevibacillus nitrificans]
MRLLPIIPWGLLFLAVVLSVAACSSGPVSTGPGGIESPSVYHEPPANSVPPPSQPATPAEWHPEEIDFDYDEMKEDVRIQLDEEPQLHSPIRTVVGNTPQSYSFFFREPMDRASVEAAVRQHVKDTSQIHYVEPSLAFHWVHDRQLRLLVTLARQPDLNQASPEYWLSAAGAKTQKGRVIADNLDFRAVAAVPSQIWQVSLDGAQLKKVSGFPAPYMVSTILDNERRYLLMYRYKQYCECDAHHIPLYAIYDLDKKSLTRYPFELTVNYRGEGTFVADRRGFFYDQPQKGVSVPESEWAVPVSVKGFVHGASFSLDRGFLLLAVGTVEQSKDLDLVRVNLETGAQTRLPGAVKGTIPTSEADGMTLPVTFMDDGSYATFIMRKSADSLREVRQRYDWKTEKVIPWNPPVAEDSWAGYNQSDDGKYQMYFNGGLYQGKTKIGELDRSGVWVPDTHLLAYVKWQEGKAGSPATQSLHIFDADLRQERVILEELPIGFGMVGASQDGKWLLVHSERDLAN